MFPFFLALFFAPVRGKRKNSRRLRAIAARFPRIAGWSLVLAGNWWTYRCVAPDSQPFVFYRVFQRRRVFFGAKLTRRRERQGCWQCWHDSEYRRRTLMNLYGMVSWTCIPSGDWLCPSIGVLAYHSPSEQSAWILQGGGIIQFGEGDLFEGFGGMWGSVFLCVVVFFGSH